MKRACLIFFFISVLATACTPSTPFVELNKKSCDGLLVESEMPQFWVQVGNPYTRSSMAYSSYVSCYVDMEQQTETISPFFTGTLVSTYFESKDLAVNAFRLTTVPNTMIPGITPKDFLKSKKINEQDFGCWETKQNFYYCMWAARYNLWIKEFAFELPFNIDMFEVSRDETRSKLKILQGVVDKIDDKVDLP